MDTNKQKVFEKIFQEHLKVEPQSKKIDGLYSPRLRNKINYKPYYQRNYVWDNNKATYFIESILIGTDIPPLIFFDNNDCIEVIDGRQRIETIYRFMDNKFSLTSSGLTVLKRLKGANWESLAKSDNQIIENFLDATIRVVEFKLVNKPPLDKILEDQVKKEIFSRYNSGITPLKKVEIDNAVYDNDDLTNHFKKHLENNPSLKNLISINFFKQLKNNLQEPSVDNIMSFIRRFLVLPRFPINYFTGGSGRTDILSKLYDYFSDLNIENQENIIFSFFEKVDFLNKVNQYATKNNLKINRRSLECFLWGLGVLDLEECKVSLDEMFMTKIVNFVSENLEKYTELDSNFSKEIMGRYSTTASFLEKEYNIDLKYYINADADAKKRIKDLKNAVSNSTKLSELKSSRLNKANPISTSVDDILRSMVKRRFMIRPSYQRSEVINPQKSSSIIESILLGIKLPPIFVYKREDGITEVIDGQQRLLTILGFTGTSYIDEKNQTAFSKNNCYALRQLRILPELNKKTFTELSNEQQDRILDFQIYVIEIEEESNPNFIPIDLFIRLNDKPYPIIPNSFEMWNSWANSDIIKKIKDLKNTLYPWFYIKQIKKSNDRDRMENEELLTSLTYIEYFKNIENSSKTIDVYQKTDRINSRISTKARISTLMQAINEEPAKKVAFESAIKETKAFAKKVKYILLDKDVLKDDLFNYLKQELDFIFKAGRENRSFRRRIQDFYFLWLILDSINFEMVKFHRREMKKNILEIFYFIKNIPEEFQTDSKGYHQFKSMLNDFHVKFSQQKRKTKLSESEQLVFIQEQGNVSTISGAPIFLGDDIEVDHNKPIAIGGSDSKDNLNIVHSEENRSKGVKIQKT